MYNVVLLIERQLIDLDADQILGLHEGVDDDVTYHVLLPVDPSAAALGASMTSFSSGEVLPTVDPQQLRELQDQNDAAGHSELEATAQLLRDRGQQVTTEMVEGDPIGALAELVKTTSADEAIILTEPHLVTEFLKIDWASRARRKLHIPTLHLLEHLPFNAQTEV